jgi:hypothetical protein
MLNLIAIHLKEHSARTSPKVYEISIRQIAPTNNSVQNFKNQYKSIDSSHETDETLLYHKTKRGDFAIQKKGKRHIENGALFSIFDDNPGC